MIVELNSREATRVAKALERGINTFDSNSRDEKTVREAFALVLKRIRSLPPTHVQTRNGRTTEISDADFKRLSKTGKTKVTDLRTGQVLTAEVTHWRLA